MSNYLKAGVLLVAAVITAVAAGVGAGEIGDIDGAGWVKIGLVVLGGTALTTLVENIAGVAGGIIKAVVAAATVFLTGLSTGYETDGVISQGEFLLAVGAAFAALAAVYQTPGPAPAPAPMARPQ